MQLKEKAWLLDILLAARQIQEYTSGITFEEFAADSRTRESTLYHFIVMGEASKRISEETRAELSCIPWGPMAQMRDFLAHHYDKMNFKKVWETVKTDIPTVLQSFEPILPQLECRRNPGDTPLP